MNIQLAADQLAEVENLVAIGRYQSVEELVAEGVRLVISNEQLRKEIQKGIDQADRGELLDGKEAIQQIKERIKRTGK